MKKKLEIIIMVMVVINILFGCNKINEANDKMNNNSTQMTKQNNNNENYNDDDNNVKNQNISDNKNSEDTIEEKLDANEIIKKHIVGRYARRYEEEIEGQVYMEEDFIDMYSDMTCDLDFQDIVHGDWDLDGNIILEDETVVNYKVEGNKLIYTCDGYSLEFIKEE